MLGDCQLTLKHKVLLWKNQNLNKEIINKLQNIDATYVITSLIKTLNSKDAYFCREILIALWYMGEKAIDPILHAFTNDSDKIRFELINVLGKHRDISYLIDMKYLYVFLSLWVALLVFLSAAGIVSGH